MAGSSFSKRHYASAFVLSAALVLLSGVYFHQLWRGVIVSDAGDAGAVSVAFGKEIRTAVVLPRVPAFFVVRAPPVSAVRVSRCFALCTPLHKRSNPLTNHLDRDSMLPKHMSAHDSRNACCLSKRSEGPKFGIRCPPAFCCCCVLSPRRQVSSYMLVQ